MLKFFSALVIAAIALPLLTSTNARQPVQKHRPPMLIGDPEIVWGVAPNADTPAGAANFALPEDAIELRPDVYVIADTQGGYVREVSAGVVTVLAGDGSSPDVSALSEDNSPNKGLAPLALEPIDDGFLSFSSGYGGINFHRGNEVTLVARSYDVDGQAYDLNYIKFTQQHKGKIVALDGTSNRLIEVDRSGARFTGTYPDVTGWNIAGFDFCGDSLVVSHVLGNGAVAFDKHSNGQWNRLFVEHRPYSNAIKCVSDDEFYYGARWELKRYNRGETDVIVDGFVHIASIRTSLDGSSLVITDSDSEGIFRVSIGGEVKTVATTKGQILSDPIIKMEMDGDDILALTPDGVLVRLHTSDGSVGTLLSPEGVGSLDKFLDGYRFTSLRSFTYDAPTSTLFLASNHGIFSLDTKTG